MRNLEIPGDYLSVSYTRDLSDDDPARAARERPSAVTLRFDLARFESMSADQRTLVLAHPGLQKDRQGTVWVHCDSEPSRHKNLAAARTLLSDCVYEALAGKAPVPVSEPGPPPKRSGPGRVPGGRKR